jgi:cytochrome-b5 reductase
MAPYWAVSLSSKPCDSPKPTHKPMTSSESVLPASPLVVLVTIGLAMVAIGVYFFSRKTTAQHSRLSTEPVGGKSTTSTSTTRPSSNDKVLSASEFRQFEILKTTRVSPNVKHIRFELPAGRTLGLALGRHVTLRTAVAGQSVMRSYTPTTRIDQKGYFDLLIKRYEMGHMSNFLFNAKVGQRVDVRGPVGRFKYVPNTHAHIGLIAGGTGLTPCLQLIRNVLECPEYADDRTSFTLFFQNRYEEDVLMYEELLALAKQHPLRFELLFFLSNTDANSTTYGLAPNELRGPINKTLLSQKMHKEKCSLVCICGPSGFNDAMKKLLAHAGHDDDSVFVW